MAFKRLRVERSPGAVWFGAIVAIFTFGAAQARSTAQFWHPTYATAIAYVYLALMLLGAYCVFRGLYGEWWRVIHVDLEARKLKTCESKILPFDEITGLVITENRLETANTKTLLYQSSAADVRLVKDLLEPLIHPGAPKRLYRLQRLAYHRLWVLFLFTLTGFALLVGVSVASLHTLGRALTYEPEFKLMWLLGMAVCLAWFRLSLFGSFSKNQLRVDPVAGVLQLADRTLVPFEKLGTLSLVERRDKYTGRRHTLMNYDLRASGVEAILYTNYERPRTQLRLDALATAMLHFQLRRALEAPSVEGDAFRSGPDPRAEAKRLAGDSPYAAAALAALAQDADPTVRARAAELVSAHTPR